MGNLASRLAVQVTLASTNSYLEQIKNNIVSFLDDVAPYVYVIVAVSLAAIGLVFTLALTELNSLLKKRFLHHRRNTFMLRSDNHCSGNHKCLVIWLMSKSKSRGCL